MNKVFEAIFNKTRKTEPKITERALYYRIETFQKKSNIVSRTLARNAYAYEVMGIRIQNLLDKEKHGKEELEELQEWLSKKPPQRTQDFKQERIVAKTPRIHKKVVDAFGLPPNLWNEANRMAKAYPDMYLFENLIRHVIMTVLEKKHGNDWWNTPNVVSKDIRETVEGRKKNEKENRWHSKRGAHGIFYTDLKDLSRIVKTNIQDFKEIFGDLEIEAEMKKLEPSRNIIAHNNPLSTKEIKRIEIHLDDVRKQLDTYIKSKQ